MRNTTQTYLHNYFLATISLFLGIVLNSYSQCPIVTSPIQSFCDINAPRILNLSAVNNGNGVKWYATATSTTPLTSGMGLVDGEDYYADNNSGTCGTRPRVDVIIYGPPLALNFQGVCVDDVNDATIADLIATGNDIQWYSNSSGGMPLATTTVLVDNTIYYVNQSNPDTGCRTSRLSVFVNVGVVPVPIGDDIQEFCSDLQPPPTVADLQASGNNNWYLTISSASPLDPSTVLIDGQSYFATTFDPPCESIERLEVLVVFTSPVNPGNDGSIDICETELGTILTTNLFDALSGSPETTGTWEGPLPTSNGNLGTVDITAMTVLGSPYIFTYSLVGSSACGNRTSTVTVTIVPPPNAGTDGTLLLCEGDAPVDLFDSLGGTPEPGGTWSPPLNSGSGIFDPSVDAPGTYTYTVSGTTPCASASSEVTVNVAPILDPGSSGTLDICEGDTTLYDLFDSLGGTPDTGGNWSPSLASGSGIFDPAIDAPGTYTYAVGVSSACGSSNSTVTVTIVPPPNAGTNGNLVLCESDAPVDLFDSLEGTPEPGGTWSPTLASGSGIFDPSVDAPGAYTYTVSGTMPCASASSEVTVNVAPILDPGSSGTLDICEDDTTLYDLFDSLGGTPDTGGTWSPSLASGSGIFDPAIDAPGTYTYAVGVSSACGSSNSTVTVTIVPPPNAGTNGNLVLCESDAPVDLFDSLGGTPEPGGTWSPSLASGTGIFDPSVDAPGAYTYTVSGTPPCASASSEVTVTVAPIPDPGNNGTLDICEGDTTLYDLFDSLGGTPDVGGTWSPALASGTGIFDPAIDAPGTYTYAVGVSSACGSSNSTVTVTIVPPPNAGTDGTLVLCEGDAPVDLFDSLGGTPDVGGTWSPSLASGSGIFDPSVDAPGTYTYTVNGTAPCASASSEVTVNVAPILDPGSSGTLDVCEDDTTLYDLFDSLSGTPDTGGTWSPSLASGSGIFDPAVDAPGTYTYAVGVSSACGSSTSTVTVTIVPSPNAGTNGNLLLCESDAPVDLFDILGGTPETGGTWSPSLASGTGIFDPSVDAPGAYTYTLSGTPPCASATSEVTVNVAPILDPGSSGTLDICESDTTLYDLFDSLGGTPDTGGTWSPSLVSGTGIFDPAIDAPGTYTYAVGVSSACGSSTSTVTVTIVPPPNAGTDGTLLLCESDAPVDLFDSLGGTPDVGGTWSPALASGSGIFDPSVDAPGTYTYTVSGTTPCASASSEVTVNVAPILDPGSSGTLDICEGDTSLYDLFDSLGGTPDPGGTWSPSLASGSGIFDPAVDAPGTYTYDVGSACGSPTSTVTVTIVPPPNAGTDGTLVLCESDAPVDLFDSLGGTPEPGGTWSPALASGSGIFDPSVDAPGTYTYLLSGSSFCGTDTSTVNVTVNQQPNADGLTLTVESVCFGQPSLVSISNAIQLDNGQYTITYTLNGANTSQTTIIIVIGNGEAQFNIPASLLNNPGLTTFTLFGLTNNTTTCGADVSGISPVQFNILQDPTPQLISNGEQFCSEDNPTIADLSANILGTDSITWYDALENGTPYSDTTALVDGTTYYASSELADGCNNGIRLEVTVTISTCEILELIIPDGFSPNDDAINDDFDIKNIRDLYPNFYLQIYNRYGNILYEGNTNTANWDGTSDQGREFGSSVLPVGVYFYILELKNSTNRTIQGRVYLSR